MKQKIIKIGNSAGIILPKEIKKELGIKLGDSVVVAIEDASVKITPYQEKKDDVDIKFAKMVDEFINDHEDVLKELANR